MKFILYVLLIISMLVPLNASSLSSEFLFSGYSNLICVVQSENQEGGAVWAIKLRLDSGLRFLLLEGWLGIRFKSGAIMVRHLIEEKENVKTMPLLPEEYMKDELKGFLSTLKCREA
ncbi:MAG: hypothetical protein A3F16_00265 [Deltaproteobacteria bacterium RIFCSPHIGHO2_12_FULL_43_9]|nr:MAG: hypothetical protein A3F16_00265 [Deltaproteobacteria bacterium RIFCSPHIGHO2_12_FULL_43_9]